MKPTIENAIKQQEYIDSLQQQFGALEPYEESLREKTVGGLINLGMPREQAQGFMGNLSSDTILDSMGLIDFTPLALPFVFDEAKRGFAKAEKPTDYIAPTVEAGLGVIEALPLTEIATRPLRRFLSNLANKSTSAKPMAAEVLNDIPVNSVSEDIVQNIGVIKPKQVNEGSDMVLEYPTLYHGSTVKDLDYLDIDKSRRTGFGAIPAINATDNKQLASAFTKGELGDKPKGEIYNLKGPFKILNLKTNEGRSLWEKTYNRDPQKALADGYDGIQFQQLENDRIKAFYKDINIDDVENSVEIQLFKPKVDIIKDSEITRRTFLKGATAAGAAGAAGALSQIPVGKLIDEVTPVAKETAPVIKKVESIVRLTDLPQMQKVLVKGNIKDGQVDFDDISERLDRKVESIDDLNEKELNIIYEDIFFADGKPTDLFEEEIAEEISDGLDISKLKEINPEGEFGDFPQVEFYEDFKKEMKSSGYSDEQIDEVITNIMLTEN